MLELMKRDETENSGMKWYYLPVLFLLFEMKCNEIYPNKTLVRNDLSNANIKYDTFGFTNREFRIWNKSV